MLTKKLLPAALTTVAVLGAGQAMAEDAIVTGDEYQGFTANVTLTSDYRFRGISQSDESIALQGGFDYSWDNGIYIGTWGSTVDFDTNYDPTAEDPVDGYDGSLELDYYIGWAFDITDNFSMDVGYLYYDYPGDDGEEGDYQELYGSVGWGGLTVGVHYSDDYYAETDTFWYYYAGYSLGLFDDFLTLDFHVGYNDLEKDGGFLATDEDSYIDYTVAATISQWGLDWSLAWVGTDLDEEDVFGTDWADDTVVFSVSRSM